MAIAKQTYTYIFIAIVVIIIIVIILYVFRCKIFKNLSSCIEDPNEKNEPVPPDSPTPKWIPEVPPYDVGMFGLKIKALQKALGISQDGKFGNETKTAIIAKGKSVPLSEIDYNAIVNSPVPGGSNFQLLKKTLAGGSSNIEGGGIRYPIQGQNISYYFYFFTNGRFFLYSTTNTTNWIKKGSYFDGGTKMIIDNGATYGGFWAINPNVFINMKNIIDDVEGV